MEFVEAVNPHYAFPIVGVIVCCLLVFAFGFKSPGQPPSFDIVEEERKFVKKRKGKENQKAKPQQNGKVTSAASTKVEATPHTPKAKVPTEKSGNKSEAKSNKKVRSQQVAKQVAVGNKNEAVQSEEGNEDGWVQLVSKKERKNRKKDDVTSSSADTAKTVSAIMESESCLQVSETPEKSVIPKEETSQAEKEKVNDSSDAVVEKESAEDTKSIAKAQRTPKKKKGKKEEEVELELHAVKELPASEVSQLPSQNGVVESKSYSSVSSSNPVLDPPSDDLLQVQEMADVSEEVKSKTKKKKGKKKSQETTAVEDIKNETNSVHVQENSGVAEQETIPKKEIVIEPKLIDMESKDSDDKNDDLKEPTSASGSNVAFDELKDLTEEKPQKKKKKVRREH